MDKFEYQVYEVDMKKKFWGSNKVKTLKLQRDLNLLGQQGWELSSEIENISGGGYTKGVILLFKRKIQ